MNDENEMAQKAIFAKLREMPEILELVELLHGVCTSSDVLMPADVRRAARIKLNRALGVSENLPLRKHSAVDFIWADSTSRIVRDDRDEKVLAMVKTIKTQDWPEDNHDWPKTASIIQGGISKAAAIKFTGPQPTRATSGSAAYDLRYTPTDDDESIVVHANSTKVLPTGLSIELPEGYAALVCSRSGLAAKHGIQVLNAPGVIDSDYRGEIGVILRNTGNDNVIFLAGDRIAQLMIVPVLSVDWVSVEALGETDRGNGGFGSTGVE